ncbi:MAG: hypothetical protein LJE57_07495 [Gallionella sp.]|nr:hypothetical protein [Gallionella sp.]
MQEINSIFFSGLIESSDVLLEGMRGFTRRLNFSVSNGLNNFHGRSNKRLFLSTTASLASRREVAIMYSGHTSESLMVTFERMAIPDGRYTLGQLLCNLYKRGDQWVDELDDDNLVCTVNGREAKLFDTIEAGAEIRISS